MAVNMRAPIVMLGSLTQVLGEALSMDNSAFGWLGSIPMPAFALGSLCSPWLARRYGLERTLCLMIALLMASLILRSLGTMTWLFVGTALMALAIGFMNTLGAPLIKKHAPKHITLSTGLLSLSMSVFAGLIAWLVLPLAKSIGWQLAMGVWALVSLACLLAWLGVTKYAGAQDTPTNHHLESVSRASELGAPPQRFNPYKSANAWLLAGFMGLQSVLFYTVASFLPSLGVHLGLGDAQATALAMTFQLAAPVAIILLTWLIKRGISTQVVGVMSAGVNALGVLGILWWGDYPFVWSFLMGFGSASIFTLTLMMFSLRTPDSDTARDVSGMVQTVGYSLAFFGPVLFGRLHEGYDSWDVSLWFLFGLMALNVVIGWFATRPYQLGYPQAVAR